MKIVKKELYILCIIVLLLSVISFSGCNKDVENGESLLSITEDFIQPWLCADWTAEQWELHLNTLKSAGYTTIILQSSAEVQDGVLAKTYFIDETIDCEQTPTVERLIAACERVGFKARIGLLDDDDWWNGINEEKVNKWNELGAIVTNSIYEKLSANFAFVGLYWTFEFYTQNKGYETYWAKLINAQIEVMNGFEIEIPLLFSPYYSTYYGLSKDECKRMWTTFFSLCNFRSFDIFAPQDGYGDGKVEATSKIDERVRAHLEAASTACKENSKAQFFVNIEMFTDTDGIYASQERISHQKMVASSYNAVGLISFSYSHYYCN